MLRPVIIAALLAVALGGCWPNDPPAHPEPSVSYQRSEFMKWVQGRSEEEVLAKLGQPCSVNSDIDPGTEYYDYSYDCDPGFEVMDDSTGLRLKFVSIHFGPDKRAVMISF